MTSPVIRLPLADLTRHPGNPRRGDVEAIRASLRVNGQYTPLIVRKHDRVILAGNHTSLALEAEGHTDADVVLVDADERRSAIIVAYDNRQRDLGAVEPGPLLALLEQLMDAGQLDGSGYSPDDVDDMRARFDLDVARVVQPFQGGYAETPESTAARAQAGEQSRVATDPVKPLVLVFTSDTYPAYQAALERCRRQWADAPAAVAVARALRKAAAEELG